MTMLGTGTSSLTARQPEVSLTSNRCALWKRVYRNDDDYLGAPWLVRSTVEQAQAFVPPTR